jgi:hypothetical protein
LSHFLSENRYPLFREMLYAVRVLLTSAFCRMGSQSKCGERCGSQGLNELISNQNKKDR